MSVSPGKYGVWAVIAGASEGIGAAFADQLAQKGFNLLLIARRQQPLGEQRAAIRERYGVEVESLALDVAAAGAVQTLDEATRDRDIGVFVFNAAKSMIGRFEDGTIDEKQAVVDLNCAAVLRMSDYFCRRFVAQRRGGMILMSSLTGLQGSPYLAAYGASKAFIRVLGESLWYEMQPHGVDVLACVAGATDTPGYNKVPPKGRVPEQNPDALVRRALGKLGKTPVVVTGGINRLAAFVTARLMPKAMAVRLMGNQMRRLYIDG